ncbi:MAG: DUF1614 domain-containing protein [Verrucomicrobia bacterium]|nr:DUF1614 domain-containing protein [Verrucomicrobiota bacterium]
MLGSARKDPGPKHGHDIVVDILDDCGLWPMFLGQAIYVLRSLHIGGAGTFDGIFLTGVLA